MSLASSITSMGSRSHPPGISPEQEMGNTEIHAFTGAPHGILSKSHVSTSHALNLTCSFQFLHFTLHNDGCCKKIALADIYITLLCVL